MHTLRHTNATLFVTVLSACLGLLIGGSSLEAYAQQVRTATADEFQSATDVPVQESTEQAQKLAAIYDSVFSVGGCRQRGEPEKVFYQNTQALAPNNQVLIVTRLPRAALNVPLVEKPAAN